MSKKNKKKTAGSEVPVPSQKKIEDKAILDMATLSLEHRVELKRIKTLSAEERNEEADGMVEIINDNMSKMTEMLKEVQGQSDYIEHLSVSLLLLTGNYEEKK